MKKKKILTFVLFILFINTVIAQIDKGEICKNSNSPISDGNLLYVGGTGPGNYTKIQYAIDDASDGDTVFVFNGTYYEDVEVYKSINLVGEDKNTTEIVHYWDAPYVITITADYVNINGFTINCYWFDRYYWGGILVGSCNNNISGNIIKGDWYEETGIEITDNSNNNSILNNIICNNAIGLSIQNSNNNTILNNIFSSNWYFGMKTYQSGNNIIRDNIFIKNEHDLSIYKSYNNTIIMNNFLETQCCTCLDIRYSNNNKIISNNITQNGWGDCITLVDNSFNNIISDNNISDGTDGITIWYSSSYNTIINNNIASNEYGIYIKEFSSNNSIYHNNFINNSKKAYDECNNSWDDGYPSGGNYWSDYTGEDIDGDGLGDTPYPIIGGDNEDRFPLISPLGVSMPIANFTYSIDESPVFFNGTPSYDPDGYLVFYEWDFGDENKGYGETIYHKFCYIGIYNVTLTVTDNQDLKGTITKSVVVTKANIPPSLEIHGPNHGRPDVKYEYVFIGKDSDGDEFLFSIDWGDGSYTSWMGPLEDGESMNVSHIWNEPGSFIIKTKLKYFCDEIDGGYLEVTIPRNRVTSNMFLYWFLERFPILEKLFSLFN